MKKEVPGIEQQLFSDIRRLIEESRLQVSQAVNAGLTLTYWNIGKRINDEILNNQRAGYGELIFQTLSLRLEQEYGKGFSEKNLRRVVQFLPGVSVLYNCRIADTTIELDTFYSANTLKG